MGRIVPQSGDEPVIEFEDIVEAAKNAYNNTVWELYIAAFNNEGDRTIFPGMLRNKSYQAQSSTLDISDINIVTLPRDAGLHAVFFMDSNNQAIGGPLVRTTAVSTHKLRRINTGNRYYRVNSKLVFPDGIPECAKEIQVMFAGTEEGDLTDVPRDIAALVERKLMDDYLPARNIPVDANKNVNPQ